MILISGLDYLASKELVNAKDSTDSGVQEKLSIIEDKSAYQFICVLTLDNLKSIGLKDIDIEKNDYIIGFNIKDNKVEVYNTRGYNGKYSLSEIKKIEE